MAIIEMINGRKSKDGKIYTYKTLNSLKKVMEYITGENKTMDDLTGGKECNPSTVYYDFILTKGLYNALPEHEKDFSKRLCVHFTQSFAIGEITPKKAKEIADELIKHELFNGHSILYATHIDRHNIHTHFIVNTTNNINGRAWQASRKDLKALKNFSDHLCKKHGLSVINHSKKQKEEETISREEYQAKRRGVSWKKEIFDACKEARNCSRNADEYINLLEKKGISVRWETNRKDISYTNALGKKINSDKLGFPKKEYTPFTKEALERYWIKQFNEMNKDINKDTNKDNQNLDSVCFTAAHLTNLFIDKKYDSSSSHTPKIHVDSELARAEKKENARKGGGIEWEG